MERDGDEGRLVKKVLVNGKQFQVRLQPKQLAAETTASGLRVASAKSLASPEPSKGFRKVVVKRLGDSSTTPKPLPTKITNALNDRLAVLRQSYTKPTDPKDLEIAMLKDETIAMKKVINESRLKMMSIQKTINNLNNEVLNIMQTLGAIVTPGRILQPPPLRAPSDPLKPTPFTRISPNFSKTEATEVHFPLTNWVDLKRFELNLSNNLTFNRAMALIRKITNCVSFKRVSSAMTAVLKSTMSPQLQNHLRIRSAPFGNVHLFKNYVSLFHLTVVRMCPSQSVAEKDIRSFLSDLFVRHKPNRSAGNESPSDDPNEKSEEYRGVTSQDDEVVKWLQGEPLDMNDDDEKEMDFEQNTSEEECEQEIVSLEPEADVLAIDEIKTEVE